MFEMDFARFVCRTYVMKFLSLNVTSNVHWCYSFLLYSLTTYTIASKRLIHHQHNGVYQIDLHCAREKFCVHKRTTEAQGISDISITLLRQRAINTRGTHNNQCAVIYTQNGSCVLLSQWYLSFICSLCDEGLFAISIGRTLDIWNLTFASFKDTFLQPLWRT